MNRQKLLIITASSWQLPVIERAQSMGLDVVATDGNPQAPGLRLAGRGEVIDCLDLDGMVAVARKHRVDGVIAEQTDVAVTTAAYVAEQLGLPGIGYRVAERATNKWLMREQCRAAGIATPQYQLAHQLDEALAAAETIGWPVVIKPVDAQASRGVAKINTAAELREWFAKTKAFSRQGAVLVEEMMTGPESSAEGFVNAGTVHLLAICEKKKCPPPYTYDLRLVYPAGFSRDVMREIEELNERVVRAIGITMGITHAEYIVTPRGVRLLEIAARGCGARVATDLIPAITGIDIIAARIEQALGRSVTLQRTAAPKAGLLEFLMLPRGVVRSMSGVDEARALCGVLELDYHVRVNDTIGEIENGSARPGYLLAVGPHRSDVLATAQRVKETVRVEVAPGDPIRAGGAPTL